MISACHCRACKRRTGSAFGVAVFFKRDQVTTSGKSKSYIRVGGSGKSIEFRFCPACGPTVFWMPEVRKELVAVALGCFSEPSTLVPTQAVHAEIRLDWVSFDFD
jgi:hypothetical protein